MPTMQQRNVEQEKNSFVHHVPTHVSRKIEADELQGVMSWGRFSGYLVCSLMQCGEIVVVAGDFEEHYHAEFDLETDEPVEHTDTS